MKTFRLQALVTPSEEGWFTAEIPALPACTAYGRTREEALNNLREMARTYLTTIGRGDYLLPAESFMSEIEVKV
jgi:predicted RNase H-like HicB family nuclease